MDDVLRNFFNQENNLSKNEKKEFYEVVEKTLDYLEIYDLEHKTIRLQVFKDLYFNNKDLPLYSIASKHNLDVKSLYHYRKNFNYIVKKLLYHKKYPKNR